MPKDSDATQAALWEEEGRRQAFSLDDCAFVLALGEKPAAAASVALGMARVQSLRRPVYVVDAVGLLPPIDDLVDFEFRSGIADVITGGKELDKIACPVEGKGKLFVLPSGATKLNHADLMANERWMQITERLREKDALMIVVVPADEPAVQFLVPEAYGSVLVGRVRSPTGVAALASISAPVAPAPVATVARVSAATTTTTKAAGSAGSVAAQRATSSNDLHALLAAAEQAAVARPHAVRRVVGYYAPEEKRPKRTRVWLIGMCLLLLALEFTIWFSRRNLPPEQPSPPPVTSQETPTIPPPAAVPAPVPAPAPAPAPTSAPESSPTP